MMSSVHNSVETVNAAATAIFTAETRGQPSTVQKRRWGSFWNLRYCCFGSSEHNAKRIGHAVLVSSDEPNPPGFVSHVTVNHSNNNISRSSSTLAMPFVAPPSSPASFLQSDAPSPADNFTSLASSLSVQANEGARQIYAFGPYAHETQLVSPPVFSAFTTEPSTASFTPPPEPVQMTTPSSPEVPFAQLLSSSLARNQRYDGGNNLGQFQSTSGTSSPFLDKHCRVPNGELTKFLGYECHPNHKWGSRLGSGSLTPNGGVSRLGSGCLTPNNAVENSYRAGKLTVDDVPIVGDSRENEAIIDHRVSFRLFDDDIPVCVVREAPPTHTISSSRTEDHFEQKDSRATNEDGSSAEDVGQTSTERNNEGIHQTVSLGSSKDFNFNNSKDEVLENEDVAEKESLGPRTSWSFFPLLQSGMRLHT